MHFRLYANCIPVQGVSESIICDLENGAYVRIPNLLYMVLVKNQNSCLNVQELKDYYKNKYDKGIDAFLDFLSKNGLGHFTDSPELFPDIEIFWKSPYKITNAIMEVSVPLRYSISEVLLELENLGCKAVEFRVLNTGGLVELSKVFCNFEESRIEQYALIINYSSPKDIGMGELLSEKFKRVSKMIYFNAPGDEGVFSLQNLSTNNKMIEFFSSDIEKLEKRGNCKSKIIVNMHTFMESQDHNLALNRKVSIGYDGSIKNYPSHDKIFGNVNQINIKEVMKNENFTKSWFVSNDKIEICKDCQYRYVCFDPSELIFEKAQVKKVSRCNFDPYKNEWS